MAYKTVSPPLGETYIKVEQIQENVQYDSLDSTHSLDGPRKVSARVLRRSFRLIDFHVHLLTAVSPSCCYWPLVCTNLNLCDITPTQYVQRKYHAAYRLPKFQLSSTLIAFQHPTTTSAVLRSLSGSPLDRIALQIYFYTFRTIHLAKNKFDNFFIDVTLKNILCK